MWLTALGLLNLQVEKRNEGAEEDAGAGEDEGEGLERGGTRSSIAERRRLYENRSMSVQEPVSPSPTPLRRRDSLKVTYSFYLNNFYEIKVNQHYQYF